MSEGKQIEVKTAELIGPALDWAAGKCSGMPFFAMADEWPGNNAVTIHASEEPVLIRDLMNMLWREHQGKTAPWAPSADWSQGGPLIDQHLIEIASCTVGGGWYVRHRNRPCDGDQQYGETLLIAACRAIVAAKLGDVVRVPAGLRQEAEE